MLKRLEYFLLALLATGCAKFSAGSNDIKSLGLDPDLGAPQCKTAQVRAIYGEDDRADWFEVDGIAKNYWASSTVALMSKNSLIDTGTYYRINGVTYGISQNLCQGVKFYEQPQAAYCSGFLVSEDLVVTAGHCIQSLADCRSTQFVFGFAKQSNDQHEYNVAYDDVYECKELVGRNMTGTDYAVVRLNRPVKGRTPLNIRRSGSVQVGDEVVLIGHPSGIPSKIAGGATVMGVTNYIVAGVDAFAGNSGSVVMNVRTGRVEGILVAGEPDFVNQGGCQVEYRCNGRCSGEVITKISDLIQYIPEATYTSPEMSCP